MTALAADRNTPSTEVGRAISIPVAASTKIYNGAGVCWNAAGNAVPAANTAGLRFAGVSDQYIDNSAGAAAAKEVRVRKGSHGFVNDGTITQADCGRVAFVVDDQTVGRVANNVPAGYIDKIGDDNLVYIRVADELGAVEGYEQAVTGIETVTSGALSVNKRTSLVSVTGTQAYTLANGLFIGQRKTIRVTVAASTPDGTLTPAAFADGTSIDLDAVNETVELEWTGTNWRVVDIEGATITA